MTEMGTSWMFCWRFCAVTMISVSVGVVSSAQLELTAMMPVMADTKAIPCRASMRRLVIPLPLFFKMTRRGG